LGKTTLARIIANSVADPFNIEELDAGGITPADLDRFRDTWATYGMDFSGGSKKGRALIVNEAHGLRKDTIRCLLVLLEEIPSHVVVVFTTTAKGQSDLFECKHDSGPLVDRCGKPIELKAEETEAMARRVMEIAQREGLDGQPLDAYKLLLARCGYSIRRALGEVESGAMLRARPLEGRTRGNPTSRKDHHNEPNRINRV
jgi:replication-associated recombination protein RarA